MLRLFLWICLFTAAAPIFGTVRGAYHNHFAIELDYVLLQRENSMNKHLVSIAGDNPLQPLPPRPPRCRKEPGKVVLDTRGLVHDMGYNSGVSAAVKVFPAIHSTWEGRYMGGFAWKGQRVWDCPENLNLDGSLALATFDYNRASHVKGIYLSKMFSYELNYHHHVTPRYTSHFSASWMAGLRYFDIDEKIKLFFTKMNRTSRYRIRTENIAFGLQLGGDIQYNPYHFLTWGVVLKGAGFFNRAKNKTLMGDLNNTITVRDIDRSGSNFSYMFQVFPFIEVRPTKHFFLIFNYQVLYIGNIITASTNLEFHGSGNTLDHGGHILYHGLTAGIQFNF